MKRFNAVHGELEREAERPGFRARSTRVGEKIGGERIGAALYELDEGERTFPYHFHHGMEEWLYVVAGSPALRTPAGERELRAGDLVCFPDGPDGAHAVRGPGRVLILSANRVPSSAEYPDSGKVGVVPPGKLFRLADAVDYWEGE